MFPPRIFAPRYFAQRFFPVSLGIVASIWTPKAAASGAWTPVVVIAVKVGTALDTAEQRRAASGIGLLLPGVTPNADKDVEWRREAGWSYPFSLATPPLWTPKTPPSTIWT